MEIVNYALNLDENASYSLVDSDFINHATLVVKDGLSKMYFEDGSEPIDFDDDIKRMMDFINTKNWYFSKMISGNHRWYKYNPNPKGKNTGDCTIRAYCAAFDIDWNEAYDVASKISKENGFILDDAKVVPKILINHFGCEIDEKYNKKVIKAKDRITINTFAMGHPYGTYVLHIHGHIVTCKNGEYWDSWDSGEKKVDTVYIVKK